MIRDTHIQRTLKGKKPAHTPFWFMRQAGRYLPEYRALRSKAKSFLTLCYTPKLAAEVTLQPIKRFDMDAAIVFSDILVIPHAMGQDVRFVEKQGPVLAPLEDEKAIHGLSTDITERLSPVAETVSLTRGSLAPEKSLIGFCGAPWTVACYMMEGHGRSDFAKARMFARRQEKAFQVLMDKLVAASVSYLSMQIKAGADIVQVFDSWAGILSRDEYEKWVIAPTQALVKKIKSKHPEVPVIGFARGSGVLLESYARKTGVDVVGIDVQTPMEWAAKHVQQPLQGNLDPILLATDKKGACVQTKKILMSAGKRPLIFNLGHGILPTTPIENVQAVCDVLRRRAA